MNKAIDNLILKSIAKEIEQKYDCKVIEIDYWNLISLCVRFKVKFNEDFIYKPFEELPKPEAISFSDKTALFVKRVDLFDCVRNQTIKN